MTFAVARKFSDRIIVVSDTMISDRDAGKPNILPGRLKSIVIAKDVSIAFAGAADPALAAVREAHAAYSSSRNLPKVVEVLKQASEHTPTMGDRAPEFIVTSHVDSATMFKIWNGTVAHGGDTYWIGDRHVFERILRLEATIPLPANFQEGDVASAGELRFGTAASLLWQGGTQVAEGVGGLLINQLGSPLGHTYQQHAGATVTDLGMIEFPGGLTEDQLRERETGKTQYSYSIIAPPDRAVAVVGVYFSQPRIGYIFSPLKEDEARKVAPATEVEIRAEVSRLSGDLAPSGL